MSVEESIIATELMHLRTKESLSGLILPKHEGDNERRRLLPGID